MFYCVLIDSVLYFINYSILDKIGLFNIIGTGEIAISGTEAQVERLLPSILDDVAALEAIKEYAVALSLRGLKDTMTGSKIDEIISSGVTRAPMMVLTFEQTKLIVLEILGLTLIDLILGHSLNWKKTVKRIIAMAPREIERQTIGMPCSCSGTCMK